MQLELFLDLVKSYQPLSPQLSSAEWGGTKAWKLQPSDVIGRFIIIDGPIISLVNRSMVDDGEGYAVSTISEVDLRDGAEDVIEFFKNI